MDLVDEEHRPRLEAAVRNEADVAAFARAPARRSSGDEGDLGAWRRRSAPARSSPRPRRARPIARDRAPLRDWRRPRSRPRADLLIPSCPTKSSRPARAQRAVELVPGAAPRGVGRRGLPALIAGALRSAWAIRSSVLCASAPRSGEQLIDLAAGAVAEAEQCLCGPSPAGRRRGLTEIGSSASAEPTFSRSSTTIRSAVRLPTPGAACSIETSPAETAASSVRGGAPERTASATFGPTDCTASSIRNRSRSASVREPVQEASASSRTTRCVWSVTGRPIARHLPRAFRPRPRAGSRHRPCRRPHDRSGVPQPSPRSARSPCHLGDRRAAIALASGARLEIADRDGERVGGVTRGHGRGSARAAEATIPRDLLPRRARPLRRTPLALTCCGVEEERDATSRRTGGEQDHAPCLPDRERRPHRWRRRTAPRPRRRQDCIGRAVRRCARGSAPAGRGSSATAGRASRSPPSSRCLQTRAGAADDPVARASQSHGVDAEHEAWDVILRTALDACPPRPKSLTVSQRRPAQPQRSCAVLVPVIPPAPPHPGVAGTLGARLPTMAVVLALVVVLLALPAVSGAAHQVEDARRSLRRARSSTARARGHPRPVRARGGPRRRRRPDLPEAGQRSRACVRLRIAQRRLPASSPARREPSRRLIAAGDRGDQRRHDGGRVFINGGALYAVQQQARANGWQAPQALLHGASNPSVSMSTFGKAYLAFTAVVATAAMTSARPITSRASGPSGSRAAGRKIPRDDAGVGFPAAQMLRRPGTAPRSSSGARADTSTRGACSERTRVR